MMDELTKCVWDAVIRSHETGTVVTIAVPDEVSAEHLRRMIATDVRDLVPAGEWCDVRAEVVS